MRITLVTIALCLLLTGICAAKLPPEARQTLYKAQLLMDQKKYSQAAAMIKTYMKSTQEAVDAQVYVVLGGAQHSAGDQKSALATFLAGHKAHPNDEFLCLNTGITLHELKRYGEAGTFFEKTYAVQKPAKEEMLFQAGSAYFLAERYKDSARVLTKLMAQAKSPRKDWIRLTIHALIESGQGRQARAMLLTLLQAAPEDHTSWKLLAKLHLESEEYSKASAALEIAYRLKAPSRQDLERLAALYNYEQAPLLAATTLQRAYGNTPKSSEALKIAALYASAGRIQQALNYLNKHSKNSSVAIEKGKLLYKARRFKEAQAALTQALGTKEAPDAHFFLALCAWEKKDWKQAKKHLSKLIGRKKYKGQTGIYLAVLEDLEQARKDAE